MTIKASKIIKKIEVQPDRIVDNQLIMKVNVKLNKPMIFWYKCLGFVCLLLHISVTITE